MAHIMTPVQGHVSYALLISKRSEAQRCYHMSNENNPGWLGYIEDYTTQSYRDYNKPL